MEALPKRHVILAVDDSPASEKATEWAVDQLYREGDEFHLFHVIPPAQYVVLATDIGLEEVVQDDPETQKRVEERARAFLTEKFASKLESKKVPYQIELVRFATDNDSIGAILCKRAEQLQAVAVVMAKHNKGAIKEFFIGSVTNYLTHHCKSPVVVMHTEL